MADNILLVLSEQRSDTSILEFANTEWTWTDFDNATQAAFALADEGRIFIISDLRNNGGYLPKGRTAFAAAGAVSRNMPEKLAYWIIVGPTIVQMTLEVSRRIFPNVRFAGAKSLEEAYQFIEKNQG